MPEPEWIEQQLETEWENKMQPILLTQEFQFISKDSGDTCANYARLLPDGQVEIETLRRYGKPHSRIMSLDKFNKLVIADKV
jgi:hypothetical protein